MGAKKEPSQGASSTPTALRSVRLARSTVGTFGFGLSTFVGSLLGGSVVVIGGKSTSEDVSFPEVVRFLKGSGEVVVGHLLTSFCNLVPLASNGTIPGDSPRDSYSVGFLGPTNRRSSNISSNINPFKYSDHTCGSCSLRN
uniref:Uncharacterized protein n=1 Tax=Steinernema glaseri TaxID=37863 RepID=A0A1I7ZCT1_9BILA